MDAFVEEFEKIIKGCIAVIAVGLCIIGGLVLLATHIQWK